MAKDRKLVSVAQIEQYLKNKGFSYEISGDSMQIVSGFSSLFQYKNNTITWIKAQPEDSILPSKISVCVVQKGVDVEAETKIISSNSKEIFFSILEEFWEDKETVPAIGAGSIISAGVVLGENVQIGCNCSIIGEINIGKGTVIGDNVVIRNRVSIGCGCTIQSLSVIGEDGFGYYEDEFHVKTMVKHFGGVIIKDDVFIGSHTNIARGTIDDTIIGKGVKIAPSTHIGHNNCIESNATIVCAKLFGSVKIGNNAYVSSSVIRDYSRIGNDAIVGMGSVVVKDVKESSIVYGNPAKEKNWWNII